MSAITAVEALITTAAATVAIHQTLRTKRAHDKIQRTAAQFREDIAIAVWARTHALVVDEPRRPDGRPALNLRLDLLRLGSDRGGPLGGTLRLPNGVRIERRGEIPEPADKPLNGPLA